MLEEARIPLVDPALYEAEIEKEKIEEEKKDRVIVLKISPKSDNTIDL